MRTHCIGPLVITEGNQMRAITTILLLSLVACTGAVADETDVTEPAVVATPDADASDTPDVAMPDSGTVDADKPDIGMNVCKPGATRCGGDCYLYTCDYEGWYRGHHVSPDCCDGGGHD